MGTLKDKLAIITGGTRGIGRAILKKYKEEGAKILFCSRSQNDVDQTCQDLDLSGKILFGTKCDLSDYDDCKKLIEKGIELFGRIDILVNNAGIYGPIGPLETNSPKEWMQTIEINLLGAVNTSRLVINQMKKQGAGKIINLAGAGVGGASPLARFSAYYTSKVAITGFTEVLASELRDYNIQVNCIAPGAVDTHLTDHLLKQDKELVGAEFYNKNLKIKSTGGDSPELAAKLVTFLGSNKSDHITGKLISAKWDDIKKIEQMNPMADNIYNLRRIDNFLFYGK